MTEIVVALDGTLRCLYTEEVDLRTFGRLEIRRASQVEPTADGAWQVDLTPVTGPVLGPFERRSQALEAESRWLSEHWLRKEEHHDQAEERGRRLGTS